MTSNQHYLAIVPELSNESLEREPNPANTRPYQVQTLEYLQTDGFNSAIYHLLRKGCKYLPIERTETDFEQPLVASGEKGYLDVSLMSGKGLVPAKDTVKTCHNALSCMLL